VNPEYNAHLLERLAGQIEQAAPWIGRRPEVFG